MLFYDFIFFNNTVGENIIGAPKLRNNYGAIQLLIFHEIAIFDFSLLLLVKVSLLILFASILV